MKNTPKSTARPVITDPARLTRERREKAERDEKQRADTALSALYSRGKRERS